MKMIPGGENIQKEWQEKRIRTTKTMHESKKQKLKKEGEEKEEGGWCVVDMKKV